jgi:SAM-dependent methyltransferase
MAYAATFEGATRLYAEALLDAVYLQRGQALLDNACGTGFVAGVAAERGATVIGADFSVAMITQARRLHPAITFEQGDAEALPYADNSFDAVVVNFGMHHFPFPERAVSEVRRVLRVGGRTAFTVWATPDRHALYAIALEAVRSAGDPAAALPVPPHGGLNTLSGCIALLRSVGLEPDEGHSGVVERELCLSSLAELIHLIESGTVRLASLLRGQPPEKRADILAGLASAASRFAGPSGLRIPLAAVLAVGSKTSASDDA